MKKPTVVAFTIFATALVWLSVEARLATQPGTQSNVVGQGGYPLGGQIPYTPTPSPHIPIVPTPHVTTLTGPVGGQVVVPLGAQVGGAFTPVLPKDVTSQWLLTPKQQGEYQVAVGKGIKILVQSDRWFERRPQLSYESMLVLPTKDAKYKILSPYAVSLTKGSLLVSVRQPSTFGLIDSPVGTVSLSNGDALISANNGVVRVSNLTGRDETCRIKLNSNILDGTTHSVGLSAGYELVVGDQKLVRSDVRPADGYARRGYVLFANGRLGVNEFWVESFLKDSPIVAAIQRPTSREKVMLRDIAKMSAVLNETHGAFGYTTETGGLAERRAGETQ